MIENRKSCRIRKEKLEPLKRETENLIVSLFSYSRIPNFFGLSKKNYFHS